MAGSEGSEGVPGPPPVRPAHDFDASYAAGQPPWDIDRPQAAFRQLAERGRLVGRVLDVGCGTGEHALMAAERGLDATGVDIASTAITTARRKAAVRGVSARFIIGNALELGDLGESFDTVLDCGLFHVFDDRDRSAFVHELRASMPVNAWYYMLCFSDLEPGDWGPRRIKQEDIGLSFSDGWRTERIEPATLELIVEPGKAHAWLASIRRT